MRKLEALKKLAVKITSAANAAAVSGDTVDEVIDYIENNFTVALKSPDGNVWDISIANDGTISGTKRT